MTKKVRWGVMGCASIAENGVIPGILGSKNSELYAIASRDKAKADAFAERCHFIKAYYDYEEMLKDENIDAVYIPLPNGLHRQWVLRAAAYHKHILCEKPMGLTAAESEEMFKVCEDSSVLLMEAFAFMHSPQTQRVKQLLDEGAIGELKHITSYQCVKKSDRRDPRFNKALGGGSIYDLACYNILISRFYAGREPADVRADGKMDKETGVDLDCLIAMDFSEGLKATVYSSFEVGFGSEYTLLGSKGSLKVVGLFNLSGDTEIILENSDSRRIEKVYCPDNYMLEIEQFSRCIISGEAPLMSAADTVGNAKVIDRARKQLYKGI